MALHKRPPVITIMGHVDHGKTTLLDYIRKSRVVAGEVGGITQHIGAYSIEFKGSPLTFIDTPGHAAFNKMRERGASVTDIVVLVVAANDGVKPQTIESIRHIQTAKVPVLVAINKVDLPAADVNLPKSQLAEHGLIVTEYGGDVETVEISALKGTGVDKLLETLAVMADLLELKADPTAPLEAVVIESSMDKARGSVASVIVQRGTLSVRQEVTTGQVSGRVRLLTNEAGERLDQVQPGYPAEIVGFAGVPSVGSVVHDAAADYTVPASSQVAETASQADPFADIGKQLESMGPVNFDQLIADEGKVKIKLIVRADVEGTLEAILQNLDDESTELIASGVGEVSEADVELADVTGAAIISFHSRVSGKVKKMAKLAGVRIKSYDIIYHLIEDLQKQQLKLLEPTIDEVQVGEAEIVQIFDMRGERIAGSRVKTGEIKKTDLLHLKRGEEIIANPVIKGMMHGKQEIDKAGTKSEFGVTFKNKKIDFQVGDILVAYKMETEEE